MRRRPTAVGILLTTLTAIILALLPGTAADAGTRHPAKRYNPPAGVKVNNPLGTKAERRAIISHIIRAIDASPRGGRIRISSWNLRSDDIVNSLIWAHRRGVSVRFIIDAGNANVNNPNAGFDRLQQALKKGNKDRIDTMKSWAKRCKGSCRGNSGISHTKMFLFSKVGKRAKWVSMFGSANATDLAAGYQWNDIYTLKNRKALWEQFNAIFAEMALDAPAPQPYEEFGPPGRKVAVYPYAGDGANHNDPVLWELAKVRCSGSTHRVARNGKTEVRIGMTAMSDERGIAIAQRLRQMWERGCNLKIVYAVMGNRVLDILRNKSGRGPIPIRQIAQDWNEDGLYDRYLHMKVFTIAGVYDGRTDANVTFNGSANWTSMALKSDEVGMRIVLPSVRRTYTRWINYLYDNPPPRPELADGYYNPMAAPVEARGLVGLAALANGEMFQRPVPQVEDPYALVEID